VTLTIGWLVAGARVEAAITGINTPTSSFATIAFDDSQSVAPPNGITNAVVTVSPWNGSLITLPLTTDPITLDQASGDLVASFAGNNYALTFSNLFLAQPAITTTGFATLAFNFSIEFQLDALGLPAQATLFPTFLLSGTVQTPPGSFAAFAGNLDYYGVNTAGTVSLRARFRTQVYGRPLVPLRPPCLGCPPSAPRRHYFPTPFFRSMDRSSSRSILQALVATV
jgi:hypothetical protein